MKEVIIRLTSDHIKVKGGEYVQDLVRCKDCKFNGVWCDIQDIQWSGYDKPVEWCSYGEVRDE